jgi:hypothetical protein
MTPDTIRVVEWFRAHPGSTVNEAKVALVRGILSPAPPPREVETEGYGGWNTRTRWPKTDDHVDRFDCCSSGDRDMNRPLHPCVEAFMALAYGEGEECRWCHRFAGLDHASECPISAMAAALSQPMASVNNQVVALAAGRRLADCEDALDEVERAYDRLATRADALEDALAWALRNKGGECPADDPAGYAKAIETLIAELDLGLPR